MVDGAEVYTQRNLTFILLPHKIIVRTSLGQEFYLLPRQHYWRKREKLIGTMIRLGEIRSLDELSSWCASGQIAWVPRSEVTLLT